MSDIVMVHSPLVGPSSLMPCADELNRLSVNTCVPTCKPNAPTIPTSISPWCDWPHLLEDNLPLLTKPIVVGHSAGGLLAAKLAGMIDAVGIVFLDARIAPTSGRTEPAEAQFYEFLRSLPLTNGKLPPWNQWWGGDVLADTGISPTQRSAFAAELPHIPISWFDDAFDMSDWSACRAAYLRTSPGFDIQADKAAKQGWRVERLSGTHLHPTLAPKETAEALLKLIEPMWA